MFCMWKWTLWRWWPPSCIKSEVILIQLIFLFLCDCQRYYVFSKNYVHSKLWCFACGKEHYDIGHHHISYPTTFATWTLCLIHDVCLLNIAQCLIKLWQVKFNELLLLNKQEGYPKKTLVKYRVTIRDRLWVRFILWWFW